MKGEIAVTIYCRSNITINFCEWNLLIRDWKGRWFTVMYCGHLGVKKSREHNWKFNRSKPWRFRLNNNNNKKVLYKNKINILHFQVLSNTYKGFIKQVICIIKSMWDFIRKKWDLIMHRVWNNLHKHWTDFLFVIQDCFTPHLRFTD